MEIKIERRAGEKYPSIAALIKALNDATFAAKRALPVVGVATANDTTTDKIVIVRDDGVAWNYRDLAQKPYGLFIVYAATSGTAAKQE